MNKFEDKIKKAADNISLSADEKDQIKDHVFQYMNAKPIRTEQKESVSYAFSSFFVAMRRTGAVVATFAIVFVLGGISAAANSALPGDVLYPIKHVLEDARSTLSVSAESKAEWEVERLERRVDEAALLEGMGELDVEKQERIDEAIGRHAQKAEELAQEVEKTDSIAALSVRTNVGIEMEARGDGRESAMGISALSMEAQEESASSADASMGIMMQERSSSAKDDAGESAPGFQKAAEEQRRLAREVIGRVMRQKDLVEVRGDTEVFERSIITPLSSAESQFEEAVALYDEGSHKQAFEAFIEVHKKVRMLDVALKRGSWRGEVEERGAPSSSETETPTPAVGEVRGEVSPPPVEVEHEDSAITVCPDEWIVNRMPGIAPGDIVDTMPAREYFIINGERVELSDVDVEWVEENCSLEKQEVF